MTSPPREGPAGSSPRVRGKQHRTMVAPGVSGLIPARAGKTQRRGRGLGASRAHPRACGENLRAPDGLRTRRGSSPRVRGKPNSAAWCPSPGWLIPARAGKTRERAVGVVGAEAHPRVCGENPLSSTS